MTFAYHSILSDDSQSLSEPTSQTRPGPKVFASAPTFKCLQPYWLGGFIVSGGNPNLRSGEDMWLADQSLHFGAKE